MKYQRVLYTTRLTAKIRSRLRIISFKKRPSLKRNVYLVGFASVADAKTADRCAKRLFNVTLKPIQSLPSDTQCVNQLDLCSFQQNLLQSAPKSAAPFSSPTAPVSFLPYFESTLIASGASPTRVGETLEERAARILGSCVAAQRDVASHPFVESMSSVGLHHRVNPTANNMAVCGKDRRRVIDEVRSCLTTMQLAHQASDRVYELHKRGLDCRAAMDNLFKVHSTAFYVKATVSAQIKNAISTGIRVSWSDVATLISSLEDDIRHQQSFMARTASAAHLSSKIDSATSIAMSSKLAYQLAKLSH